MGVPVIADMQIETAAWDRTCYGSQDMEGHLVKSGETYVKWFLGFGMNNRSLCKSCAKKFLEELKPILNSDLWAFR